MAIEVLWNVTKVMCLFVDDKYELTIIEPVGDGRDSDAALERGLLGAQQHGRHVAAVAPAPHCHACHVQELERF